MDRFRNYETVNRLAATALFRAGKLAPRLLLACVISAICGCGGNSGSNSAQNGALAANWQFSMSAPSDGSFVGNPSGPSVYSVLQGGFLLQSNGSVTGQAVFSLWLPQGNNVFTLCNSGTATITGTLSGQTVSLTATMGTLDQNGNPTAQTFTLSNGQLSSDNSTIQSGTYSSTAGYYYPPGSTTLTACGGAESNVPWSAISVPAVTGTFQGFFHSTGTSGSNTTGLAGQVFPVTGSLTQGQNTGASSVTVTGSLLFTGYPCMSKATLNGTISGSSVVLQIFNSTTGSDAGQIGGWNNEGGTSSGLVTYDNTSNGYVLQNQVGTFSGVGYALATSSCPLPPGGTLSPSLNGDQGNICFAFGAPNPTTGTTACSEPITITPVSAAFPAQVLLSGSRMRQVVTVNNIQPSGSSPLNLKISMLENDGFQIYAAGGDFNGLPSFTEQDNCTGSAGLAPQQSCSITVSFSPQQSCPWLPFGSLPAGLAPAKCPGLFNPLVPPKASLSAVLTVGLPSTSTPDSDTVYSVPVTGTGLSALAPYPPELDFGAVDVGETSLSQQLAQQITFTNQSTNPVQILSALTGSELASFQQLCNADLPQTAIFTLPRPQNLPGNPPVPGLLVVANNKAGIVEGNYPFPNGPTPSVSFYCDLDSATALSSFQISSDGCSGQTLAPNAACTVTITFAPQPDPSEQLVTGDGWDFFLQLNTLQCALGANPAPPSETNPCELDSGRFPVALTANPPGPLRMAPAAGLDFGTWLKGSISTPLSITLTNDQADGLTVDLIAKPVPPVGSDYTENDNCPATLSPGVSCVLNFIFTPSISGIDDMKLVMGYNTSSSSGNQYGLTQNVYLRGMGQ